MDKYRFQSLQASRAIAALLVVLCHLSVVTRIFLGHGVLSFLYPFGQAGVSFFFVLSGFIVCHAHWDDINNPKRLKRYFIRRLTRILPAYWTILIIISLLYFYFGYKLTLPYFLKNMFFISYGEELIIAPAWTLGYEMLFYIFFSFFIIRLELGVLLLISWIAFICCSNFISSQSNSLIDHIGSFYCLEFLFGMAAAYIIKNSIISSTKLPIVLLTLGLVCFISTEVFANLYANYFMYYSLLYAFFSSLIILGLVKLELNYQLNFPKFLLFLGAASYSIYLTHTLTMAFFFRLAIFIIVYNSSPLIIYILSCFILMGSVSCGVLFYKYYESEIIVFIRSKMKETNEKKLIMQHI